MRIPNPLKLVEAAFCAFIYWFRGYEIIVPGPVEDSRLSKCENCLDFDSEIRQCNICTCFVDAKVVIASERCPKHKWGRWKRKRPNDKCGHKCKVPCR